MPCKLIRAVCSDLWRSRAFIQRGYFGLRREWAWNLADLSQVALTLWAVVLIGVRTNDPELTRSLAVGGVMWAFLSFLFSEIAHSVSQEYWNGTIESTFSSPISRLAHLAGVSLWAFIKALFETVLIAVWLGSVISLDLSGRHALGLLGLMLLSGLSLLGVGFMVAALSLLQLQRGYVASQIVSGLLLVVSGVYWPLSVLPAWLQRVAAFNPAAYGLSAAQDLAGIGSAGSEGLALAVSKVATMLLIGLISMPLGLLAFQAAEAWAKKHGRLKRFG